jgi:hypothetical protein
MLFKSSNDLFGGFPDKHQSFLKKRGLAGGHVTRNDPRYAFGNLLVPQGPQGKSN